MDKSTIKQKLQRTEYDLYADLEKIKSAIADIAEDVRGKTGEIIDEVKEKGAVVQENVCDYVGEKPLKSIGMAVLTGVVIGWLCGNRKKDEH
jgi:ElaB/YqjD/DUF883 family membrane-anchored ribosome-binding protein